MQRAEEILARRRHIRLILLWILVGAFALRLWGIGFGLPQKVHPDEPLLADRAVDALVAGNYNPEFFHWPSFVIYFLFFEYSLIYYVGHLAGVYGSLNDLFQSYYSDPTFYFLAGRITTSLFCLAGMVLIYLTGRQVAGKPAGLAAAVLLGYDSLFVEHSRYITPDIPSVTMMLYVWYCLLDYSSSGKTRSLYAAAFVAGVATSTKYNAAFLLIPVVATGMAKVHKWPEGVIPRISVRMGAYVLISLVLFLLGFIIFTPYSILDAGEFLRQVKVQLEHQWRGHIGMEAGGSAFLSLAAYFYSPYGIALLALTLGGLAILSKPVTRGLILLSFPALYLLSIAGWVVWAPRYLLFFLPICFLSAGVSIAYIAEFIMRKKKEIAAVVMSAILVSPSFLKAVSNATVISRKHTRVASLEWIENNIPSGSRLFIEMGGPEPYHSIYVYKYGLDVSPIYDYPEPFLWLNAYSAKEKPLNRLRELDPPPEYIISSSYTRDRYFNPETRKKHPELTQPWIEYYTFIDEKCRLLVEFKPGAEYTGPTIRIYRLPPETLE